MDKFLSKYINENNLKAAVIMRNERDGPLLVCAPNW